MPWVRFDDQYTIHRKVKGLSDPAFRLHAEAIFWCARNLTDGFVSADDLPDLATARRPLKFLPELLSRGCWSEVDGGWQIHDYLDYQPSKTKVLKERADNAERQKRFRDQRKPPETELDSESNGVSNAVTNGGSTETPSRPVPSRRDEVLLGAELSGVSQSAGTREANRWLHQRYGLTDTEAIRVITEVHKRAAGPVKHLVPYLVRMADQGHLADIVGPIQLATTPPPPELRPPVQLPMLQAVPDLPGQARSTDPNAAFLEAKARIDRRKRGAS